MSYPILYNATETNFDHNGIGILSACVSCQVTEEANGIFEAKILYPMDGVHFEDITLRSIIKIKIDNDRSPQLFRVYSIGKPLSGIVSIFAEHISYDLSGIPVSHFSATNAYGALAGLKHNAVLPCVFDFWTDKSTEGNFKVSAPASIRSRLGGVAGSILDVYGGEYEFDNFTVKLHKSRGENRGVSIRYGKNLTNIQQDQNCANVFTGVYPYWSSPDLSELVELPEKIIYAPGVYNFERIRTLDLSLDFTEKPSVSQLRSRAQAFVKSNNIGVPSVSLTVSFVQLAQYAGYSNAADIEKIGLFDSINVEFPALAVSTTAKVVMVVTDTLQEKIESITLGSVRSNIADSFYEQEVGSAEVARAEANRAVTGQSAEDVFNRLTDNGRIQGLFVEGNKWHLNAEVAVIENLVASKLRAKGTFGSVNATSGSLSITNHDEEQLLEILSLEFGAAIMFRGSNGSYAGSIIGGLDRLILDVYDEDTGEFQNYRLRWSTINGVKVLTGYEE